MAGSPKPSSGDAEGQLPLCTCKKQESSSSDSISICRTIAVSVLCGLLFGWFLQKSNVYIPDVIFRQMKMEQFTMIKVFLSALAAGQVALSLIYLLHKTDFDLSCSSYYSCQPHGIVATALGATMLGSGIAISGSCPGTVMAQIGGGLRFSGVVFAGGLTGCLVFILLHPILSKYLLPIWSLSSQKQQLSTWFGISYWKISLTVAFFMAVIVATLEVFLPYRIDYPYPEYYRTRNTTYLVNKIVHPIDVLSDYTWPPYIAGIGIGLLQVPLVIALQDTLGSSSAWITFIANVGYWIMPSAVKKSDYLMRSKDGMGNYWQVIYLAAAAVGAMLSALSSNMLIDPESPIDSFNPIRSFFGGFLLLFGARLAGGCTSGHGISGFGLLYTSSVIAVAFMFGGAIFTAFAMDSFSYGGSFFRVP